MCVSSDTSVGYGGSYDQRGGVYDDRAVDGGYRRSDPLPSAIGDSDPYYSSFSDPPTRGYSRDYNHGTGAQIFSYV